MVYGNPNPNPEPQPTPNPDPDPDPDSCRRPSASPSASPRTSFPPSIDAQRVFLSVASALSPSDIAASSWYNNYSFRTLTLAPALTHTLV